MMSRLVPIGVLVGSLVCATVASADPPCMKDIQTLCPNVPANGWLIQDCLRAHEGDLSKGCRAHVDDLKETAADLADSCVWDIERLCGEELPGGGRVVACLKEHRERLSPTCKERFAK